LIGDRNQAEGTARVLGFLFPVQHRASSAYCAFDMRWVSLVRAALISRDLDQRVSVIAWIHTHPRLSVFLSGTDISTIDDLQTLNPLTLAVVVDPFRPDIGAFHVHRRERDTQIAIEDIKLDESFAAALRSLANAPQLSDVDAMAFGASPDIARGNAPTQKATLLERFTALLPHKARHHDADIAQPTAQSTEGEPVSVAGDEPGNKQPDGSSQQ
jgi:proteasome lid subunit RPN8/RPN11